MLSTLYWPDEVRALDELELPEEQFEFKPAERKMAEQLVAAMKAEFEPERYQDDYRQALLAVIEAKVAGREPEVPRAVEPATKLTDLMAVLEASVAAARDSRGDTSGDEVAATADSGTSRRRRTSRADAAPEPATLSGGRSSRRKGEADEDAGAAAKSAKSARTGRAVELEPVP